MVRWLAYIKGIGICVVIWMILNESMAISTIITGFFVGVLVIYFSKTYLLEEDFHRIYPFRVFWMIIFMAKLIIEIYRSSFQLMKNILTGKMVTEIVEIDTELEGLLAQSLLANAITLTPGTVTVDMTRGKLKVLWQGENSKGNQSRSTSIKGNLEKYIKKGLY